MHRANFTCLNSDKLFEWLATSLLIRATSRHGRQIIIAVILRPSGDKPPVFRHRQDGVSLAIDFQCCHVSHFLIPINILAMVDMEINMTATYVSPF